MLPGREADTRGLCRDETLKIDDVEKNGLQELSLQDRASNLYERFMGEHDRPFGNGVEITLKSNRTEDVEERRLEHRLAVASRQTAEVFEIRRAEAELPDVIDDRAHS